MHGVVISFEDFRWLEKLKLLVSAGVDAALSAIISSPVNWLHVSAATQQQFAYNDQQTFPLISQ